MLNGVIWTYWNKLAKLHKEESSFPKAIKKLEDFGLKE